ncbi:WD repeat-containing protein 3 [Cydia fagiglandana]|uniref:WD repeat-containing protein 3 n=1 Tax=Cydia fagiglandana TaxID=1458189 RepID=UPI002FEE37FA
MGLTKQYLRYAPSGTFNIIASADCNCTHVSLNGVSGRYVAVGACEHVIIWDMRLGEKAQVLSGENVVVSQIAASPTGNHMAVGYVDGNISVFELVNNEIVCQFAGHKSAITCLQYDEQGHRLVSGSKDTEVILWDVVSETGIARFSGHKGAITSVLFINGKNCIVSSSKDTFVKFWDIETKHCFKTLGGHQMEVWSAALMKEERYLVTGSMDQELRVWKLNWTSDVKEEDKLIRQMEIVKLEETDNLEDSSVLQCHQVGTLMRGGKGRVVGLTTDLGQTILACYGTDSLLEIFSFCTDEEAKQRMSKRIKKQRKKLTKQKEAGEVDADAPEVPELLSLTDEVRRLTSIKLGAKLKSNTLLLGVTGELRVGVTLADNSVELHSLKPEEDEVKCLKQIRMPGHQKEPRCVAISSDNLAVLSASADSVKLWNRPNQSCLRTIPLTSGRPTSLTFLPGDRHAAAGCADGSLLILDVGAGAVIETVPAHQGECSSIAMTPDSRGCVSGGADKTVKFWQFELIPDPTGESKAKVLSLLHTRTLELEEAVTAVKISPNYKFIAVALMDSTVKIFFVDTFKFYLQLYGHKLPVHALDISYDSNIIATGSSDRNVKIWGMDFGDCHKSIFAHNDSVTSLQFVPSTHYFFTASKDGKVKQWDADTYDNIITLQGHAGSCHALAVGAGGLHVASCGSENALRLYTRTEEPLVLGDTDEQEEGLATGETHAPVPGLPGLTMPTKKTIGAEKAADSIMECLSIGAAYKKERSEARGQPVQPPLLMAAYNCDNEEDFLLETLKKIRASDLQEALLLLPFNTACDIVRMLPSMLERGVNTELLCRTAIFLLKVHHAPLKAHKALLKPLIQIQAKAVMRLSEMRDMVGYNVHALQWMRREAEAADAEQLFREATDARRSKDRRRRARQALKRPIVTVT